MFKRLLKLQLVSVLQDVKSEITKEKENDNDDMEKSYAEYSAVEKLQDRLLSSMGLQYEYDTVHNKQTTKIVKIKRIDDGV